MLFNKMYLFWAGFILILSQSLTVHAAEDLNQQIDILADKLASSSKADVVKGSDTQVYIALGQNDGVLPGNKFEIVRLGEALKVGDEIIGYEEAPVAEVEVTRAREKVSICKILTKTETPKAGDKAHQLRKTINSLVVGQFSYNQSFNRLTKSLQEKLVTAMAGKGMQVVERDQLERVLKEQKLGYSGLINTNSAKKIGQLLGADGMMLGTINDMGNSITINARLVDMETGKTVSASEVELPKTPLIAQLLDIPVEDKLFTQPKPAPPNVAPKKTNLLQSVDGFDFQLQKCTKSGTIATCKFLVTSTDSDRELLVYANSGGWATSKMYDNFGNEYRSDRVHLANCTDSQRCRMRMIGGIPTLMTLIFKGLASDATQAALVEVMCHDKNSVQFRNVEFTK